MDLDPILVDRQTAKKMLGGIGDTKFYELVNSGEIEARYFGSKRVFTYASLKAFTARLSDAPSTVRNKTNKNMKYCGD